LFIIGNNAFKTDRTLSKRSKDRQSGSVAVAWAEACSARGIESRSNKCVKGGGPEAVKI